MSEEIGRVVKVAGPVVDVAFPQDNLPELNFALEVDITIGDSKNTITLEVAQHIGENKVRAVSMQATDGLKRNRSKKYKCANFRTCRTRNSWTYF